MNQPTRKRAVVICPGRGSYHRNDLGYLSRYHADKRAFVTAIDTYRQSQGQAGIHALDSADVYCSSKHASGDNASAIIYTCAMADLQSIDRGRYDIVAVTGNSMGWYLALVAGGVVDYQQGLHIVNTMGTWMHQYAKGGQVIYPLCNDQWQHDKAQIELVQQCLNELNKDPKNQISLSIDLGAMAIFAANTHGVNALLNTLPKVGGQYPYVLPHHGAFHSELMRDISSMALDTFSPKDLCAPSIPLIDGAGHIWQPYSTQVENLWRYTFDDQVCTTFHYSNAVEVACKEYAPDCLIILGPGSTLGPPTAQELIKHRWQGITDKTSFKRQQLNDPFVLSMGIDEQRKKVIALNAPNKRKEQA